MSKYSIDGKVFRYHRNKVGISLREMAGNLRMDNGNLSKIEKNKLKASTRVKLALANYFETTYAQLKIEYITIQIKDSNEED